MQPREEKKWSFGHLLTWPGDQTTCASHSSKTPRKGLGSQHWAVSGTILVSQSPGMLFTPPALLLLCESAKGCFKTTHGISMLIGWELLSFSLARWRGMTVSNPKLKPRFTGSAALSGVAW